MAMSDDNSSLPKRPIPEQFRRPLDNRGPAQETSVSSAGIGGYQNQNPYGDQGAGNNYQSPSRSQDPFQQAQPPHQQNIPVQQQSTTSNYLASQLAGQSPQSQTQMPTGHQQQPASSYNDPGQHNPSQFEQNLLGHDNSYGAGSGQLNNYSQSAGHEMSRETGFTESHQSPISASDSYQTGSGLQSRNQDPQLDYPYRDTSLPSSSPFQNRQEDQSSFGHPEQGRDFGAQLPAPSLPYTEPFQDQQSTDNFGLDNQFGTQAQDDYRDPYAEQPLHADAYGEPQDSMDASYYEGEYALDNYRGDPPPRPRRGLFLGTAAITVILFGGGAAYAVKNGMVTMPFGDSLSGDTPLVRASSKPVKEKPTEPSGREFANKNKAIYDRLQNTDGLGKNSERLVSRQEDVLETTTSTAGISIAGGGVGLGQQPGRPASLRGAVNNSAERTGSTGITDPTKPSGPRKVRTLIVRPDGTILKPAKPTSASASDKDINTGLTGLSISNLPNSSPPKSVQQVKVAQAGSTQTVSKKPAISASLPARKSTSTGTASSNKAATAGQRLASLDPKPAVVQPKVKKAAPAAAKNEKFAIQVASNKSQTDALATFATMQQKYSSILGSLSPRIEKVNLGTRGTWYRLQIGSVTSKDAARRLCLQLKNAGLKSGCIIRKI